jgi:hypothetical protein
MRMSLEDLNNEKAGVCVVRKFNSPEELAIWYKLKTGKELPQVLKPQALCQDNNVDTFYSIMEVLEESKVRLNAIRNTLEVIPQVLNNSKPQVQAVPQKIEVPQSKVPKIVLKGWN